MISFFIRLYFIESGLEIVTKKFDEIEKIYSLEFIDSNERLLIIGEDSENPEPLKILIWDLYNTGNVETIMLDDFCTIEDLGFHFVRTSGNLLQVDDKGNVTSILKKIELKRKRQSDEITYSYVELGREELNGELDKSIIHFDKSKNSNFKPIVVEIEPWVMENYEKNYYCLYGDKKETQLIVGRSTIQIWRQIYSDDYKKKDKLPNKGRPFLEYIWVNDMPLNQEREETKLRIEEFRYGLKNDILNDFYLKVYWYERVSGENDENIEEENKEIEEIELGEQLSEIKENGKTKGNIERREKVIQRKDVIEKFNVVKHACEALNYLNKRRRKWLLILIIWFGGSLNINQINLNCWMFDII
jgi:hypothetical protein